MDIKKAEEMPAHVLVHFLNVQLKRKLLNKVLYKFPEQILVEKSPEEENMIDTTSGDSNLSSFKMLWFTMQHFSDVIKCRHLSQGVECVWQDPNGNINESDWQLLLFKVPQ